MSISSTLILSVLQQKLYHIYKGFKFEISSLVGYGYSLELHNGCHSKLRRLGLGDQMVKNLCQLAYKLIESMQMHETLGQTDLQVDPSFQLASTCILEYTFGQDFGNLSLNSISQCFFPLRMLAKSNSVYFHSTKWDSYLLNGKLFLQYFTFCRQPNNLHVSLLQDQFK